LQPDNVEKKAQEIKKIWNINDGGGGVRPGARILIF